jgi:hypothetical protein
MGIDLYWKIAEVGPLRYFVLKMRLSAPGYLPGAILRACSKAGWGQPQKSRYVVGESERINDPDSSWTFHQDREVPEQTQSTSSLDSLRH